MYCTNQNFEKLGGAKAPPAPSLAYTHDFRWLVTVSRLFVLALTQQSLVGQQKL